MKRCPETDDLLTMVQETLDLRSRLAAMPIGSDASVLAQELTRSAVALAVELIGPFGLAHNSGIASSQERCEVLGELERQLLLIRPIIDHPKGVSVEGNAPIGLAIAEIHAIRMGDVPRLFARIPGQKFQHRLRVAQWRALVLDAIGEGLGLSAAQRQSEISGAFNVPWSTIQTWKKRQPVPSTPSDDHIDLEKDLADHRASAERVDIETWRRLIAEAASMYHADKWARVDD